MLMCRNHPEVIEGVRRCARCGSTFCRDCLVDIEGRPHCATCKNEQLMDVRSGVAQGRMPLATFWPRFAALLIDYFILTIPTVALIFIGIAVLLGTGRMDNDQTPMFMNIVQILSIFFWPLYEGIMYSVKNGQTVGKLVLRLRVVRADGSPITSRQGWGRAWMRAAFLCFSIFDYIPFFYTDEKTTVHDMVAKTRVVQE